MIKNAISYCDISRLSTIELGNMTKYSLWNNFSQVPNDLKIPTLNSVLTSSNCNQHSLSFARIPRNSTIRTLHLHSVYMRIDPSAPPPETKGKTLSKQHISSNFEILFIFTGTLVLKNSYKRSQRQKSKNKKVSYMRNLLMILLSRSVCILKSTSVKKINVSGLHFWEVKPSLKFPNQFLCLYWEDIGNWIYELFEDGPLSLCLMK